MTDSGAGTARTFSDKWSRNPDLAFAQTVDPSAEISRWILTRNGFGSGEGLAAYLSNKRRILDAGCGNGRVTALTASAACPTRRRWRCAGTSPSLVAPWPI